MGNAQQSNPLKFYEPDLTMYDLFAEEIDYNIWKS